MNKILACLLAALVPTLALAEDHNSVEAEIHAAVEAFNGAYAANEVDTYFSYYDADAILYFYGARQIVADYHKEWSAMVDAGGAVEKNELSDRRVQVLPSGDVAISSYFIDYQMRSPDGEITTAKAYETEVWQKIDGQWKIISLHYTEIPDEDSPSAIQ